MITSWRYLVVNGVATAERDLKALDPRVADQRRIRERLDKAVETLNADGNPFAPTSAVPGLNSFEVIAQDRTPYRVYTRRKDDVLVLVAVTRGGHKDAVGGKLRRELLSRLEAVQGPDTKLARPKPLGERPTKAARETSRGSRSRSTQTAQAEERVSPAVFSNAEQARSDRYPKRYTSERQPMAALVETATLLKRKLEAAASLDAVRRLSPLQLAVQLEINTAKKRDRDQIAEWAETQSAVVAEIEQRALEVSPLPLTASRTERIDAGVRAAIQAETVASTQKLATAGPGVAL